MRCFKDPSLPEGTLNDVDAACAVDTRFGGVAAATGCCFLSFITDGLLLTTVAELKEVGCGERKVPVLLGVGPVGE